MPEPKGHAVGRVCKEDVDLGVFAYVDVETFGADFMGHLVVENLEACLGVLADVQNGMAEIVIALEHGHFVCVVGNVPLHGAGVIGYGQQGRKVCFVGVVRSVSAGFRKLWRGNLCHREECPQLVVAAGHSDLL